MFGLKNIILDIHIYKYIHIPECLLVSGSQETQL